jgi:hypothetical protein
MPTPKMVMIEGVIGELEQRDHIPGLVKRPDG